MEWFNGFGLAFVAAVMIPNIVFAIRCRDGFENLWKNRTAEIIEQIGRYGCMGFMVFNVPGTWLGWWSDEAFAAYLAVGSALMSCTGRSG